ncbi:Uncharacterised protein [Mycobacterium tuberculosis]|nr:Uncharacterised protein [Mycobacterium tuberculosis]
MLPNKNGIGDACGSTVAGRGHRQLSTGLIDARRYDGIELIVDHGVEQAIQGGERTTDRSAYLGRDCDRVDVHREQCGRGRNIGVSGSVITQFDDRAQVWLDEIQQRLGHNTAQRLQQRQILVGKQNIGGVGVRRRHRQDDTRSDLLGREPVIQAVRIVNTQQRVDVRQDVERVLREVGKAVVLGRVNGGRVVGVRGRTVERQAERLQVQTRKPGEDAPVWVVGVAQQYERELIRTRRDAGRQACQMAHFQGGDRRALRETQHHNVIAGRDLLHDRGVKIAGAFGDRLVVGQAGDAGPRLKLRGRVQAGKRIAQVVGCDVAVVDLLHVVEGRSRGSGGAQNQRRAPT